MTSLRTRALLALLPLALLADAAAGQKVRDGIITYPTGFVMEVGEPGQLPPPALGGDALLVHGDEGGAMQMLQGLAAGAGGFSATWIDKRDGNLALFLGHLDAAGTTPLDGAPVHLPRSSRQGRPQLALTPGAPEGKRSGVVTWVAEEMDGSHAMLRFIDVAGADGTDATAPTEGERASGATLVDLPVHLAKLLPGSAVRTVLLPGGIGLVAWLEGDKIRGYQLETNAATGRLTSGRRLLLAEGIAPLAGDFHVALGATGVALVVWTEQAPATEDAPAQLITRGLLNDLIGGATARLELGPGRPLKVLADGSAPGYYLMISRSEGTALLHLDATGASDREPMPLGGPTLVSAELTTWADGKALAVLTEARTEWDGRAVRRSAEGRIDLHIFGPDGKRLTPPNGIDALDEDAVEARTPHVAGLGASFLVAWTDRRQDAGDIYYRLIDLADPGRPARRWNQDEGSSDQVHASVASDGARRAVVAWEDERSGTARIWARPLRLEGGGQRPTSGDLTLGREVAVDADGEDRCAFPTVAMAEDGGYLVTWKQSLDAGARTWIIRTRAFAADGTPRGDALDLDRGHTANHAWPAATLALPRQAGYLVAWIRTGAGPVVQRLDLAGRPAGQAQLQVPRPMGDAPNPRNPDLVRLDGGQVVLAWDQLAAAPRKGKKPGKGQPPEPPAWRVFASLLEADGRPTGTPLTLGSSPSGGDHDPALAAIPGGGFLCAWTGNDGPTRDVLAQAFDERGRAASPPMGISVKANEQDFVDAVRLADGRVLVAWEDDISGRDHCFARAVDALAPSSRRSIDNRQPQRGELFPRSLLNDIDTLFVEDRHAPRLAPMAGGYLAVWDDLARGKGHDVVARWFALP